MTAVSGDTPCANDPPGTSSSTSRRDAAADATARRFAKRASDCSKAGPETHARLGESAPKRSSRTAPRSATLMQIPIVRQAAPGAHGVVTDRSEVFEPAAIGTVVVALVVLPLLVFQVVVVRRAASS